MSSNIEVLQRTDTDHAVPVLYKTLTINNSQASGGGQKPKPIKAHLLKPEDVYVAFSTHPVHGLDEATIKRKRALGVNQLSPPKTNYLLKFLTYTFGGFNALMWLACILCILSYQPLGGDNPQIFNLGVGILLVFVIMISTFFYAYVDWNANRIMKSIQSLVAEQALVIREGKEVLVDAIELVPGDIVLLSMGQRVPADIRLLEVSSDLKFDRSLLTGESKLINATVEPTDENALETKNLALSSTFVVQGRAKGVVFQIGDNTIIGQIVKMSGKQKESLTPIQKEINFFTIIISSVAAFFFALSMLIWGVWIRVSYPNYSTAAGAITNAIGCLTAFVPQGLPVCFALALTIIAKRMAERKVLVKNLSTIETLGCMSVLCSDKTGTLTLGKMSVQSVVFLDKTFDIHDNEKPNVKEMPGLESVFMVSKVCCDAKFSGSDNDPIQDRPVQGDATDAAVLRFSEYMSQHTETLEPYRVLFSLAFNSKNKYMAKIVQFGKQTPILLVKGAPDILVPSCSKTVLADRSEIPLDAQKHQDAVSLQQESSAKGLRMLALCQKTIDRKMLLHDQEWMEKMVIEEINQLTLVGLVGIRDPPRQDALPTVKAMRRAGVRVFMVTGDFELTAVAIAKQVGIVTCEQLSHYQDMRTSMKAHPLGDLKLYEMKPDDHTSRAVVINGKELIDMTDAEWDYCATTYSEMVFARTTPEQKLTIVENLKRRGDNIVAVTGDGTNDAPALKAADIGVSMGSGSDVAKEAASMILLNNDFASLLIGIENGRLVFENLKKVVLYLMPAGTYSQFMAVVANVFLGMQIPMSSFQMVLFSVFNDIPMAISLMYETAESNLMIRKPRNARTDRLTDFNFFFQIYIVIGPFIWIPAMAMWFNYMAENGLAFYDLLLVYDKWADQWAGKSADELASLVSVGQCIYYVTLAVCQFGSIQAVRNRFTSIVQSNPVYGPRKNHVILVSMIVTTLVCVIALYTPGIQNVFDTAPIPIKYWFIPFGFALGILFVDEIRKLIVRMYPSSIVAKLAW
ncbi:calcium ATPase transmembrane domain M-containing protein [Gorgonomyces haynaldii]|nr:calcium ATPase transmembrane domain M-containing protein [Gorgonomyces haynaldii]